MPSEPHATFASDIGNKWLAGWTSTIPSVVTSATREEQCERIPFLGGADFTYYKPSEQDTLFTAYSECYGDNHFKAVKKADNRYKSFGGIKKNAKGSVKFVIETDPIEADEN